MSAAAEGTRGSTTLVAAPTKVERQLEQIEAAEIAKRETTRLPEGQLQNCSILSLKIQNSHVRGTGNHIASPSNTVVGKSVGHYTATIVPLWYVRVDQRYTHIKES